MNAGANSNGAEDAWWNTALRHELLRLQGIDYTGGSADIFKCFDQVDRQLLYKMLQKAGFPTRILNAYKQFIEHHMTYNAVASGLGTGHKRENGIPQGCPLSMMLIAFLLNYSP